jgi:hypothetical protein
LGKPLHCGPFASEATRVAAVLTPTIAVFIAATETNSPLIARDLMGFRLENRLAPMGVRSPASLFAR